MEVSTRAAASTSIGEVQTRNHQQSESEDQYETGSRTFTNRNHCHAVTCLFYRINKCQTVKFELASIDRRVDDTAAPTGVTLNPPKPVTSVAVRPSAVLATGANRLDVARRALESVAVEGGSAAVAPAAGPLVRAIAAFTQQAIPVNFRPAALQQVDQDLVTEGLLDKFEGPVSPPLQKPLDFS